jgi:hypothetical protein
VTQFQHSRLFDKIRRTVLSLKSQILTIFRYGAVLLLLLPQVKRLLTDPMLDAEFHHRVSGLRLPQYPQNLLFAVFKLADIRFSSRPSREPLQTKILNFNAA